MAKTLVCRLTLLAALSCLGCVTTGSQKAKEASDRSKEEADAKPLRAPKPGTLVAWAVCRQRQADGETTDPRAKRECYDQARQAYQEAIRIDPEHMPAYIGLARLFLDQGQVAKAIETYHQALEKRPKDASLWYSLGMCHGRAKQWELAIGSLQKAHEIDKGSQRIAQTLGFCQARAGRADESVAILSSVMTPAEANFNVARMMKHMKREDLCRQYLRQALQIDPELAAARSFLESLDRPAPAATEPAAASSVGVELNFDDTP